MSALVRNSRWWIGLAGTALLAGLAWVFGPLLPPFDDTVPRAAVVAALLVVWAVANLLLDWRRRQRDGALSKGLTADAAEETAAVREKLATALRLLKRTGAARGALYEQPWYAIIGPPGAGKTTALLNAGLRFPLAEEMGQGAVAGVGGTRLCEWWFTDDAVLIDTAGRYTTQDSDAVVDRAGWQAFLDLLRRTRPRQPLNGVLVAIALNDIAQAQAAERAAHAAAIRARIAELETRLGVRMPVYALFTKSDLIAGFAEFFDDLDEAGRAQVWGTTFALGAGPAGFAADFSALIERLNARMYVRLQAEQNPERRARIAQFPTQVASLAAPLDEFVQVAFAGGKDAPLLRGVYLTSGTQEGTPIDRLLGGMARAFGIDQTRIPSFRAGQGRSFFLGKLLREVVFGEAMLVARNPAAARRRTIARAAGFTVAGLLVLAAGGLLWRIQNAGQGEIDAAQAVLDGYEQAAQTLKLDPVADADLQRLAPLLDQAAALPLGFGTAAPPWWNLGLSQREKLAAAARAVYRHALQYALLPRLVWRLEAQLRGNMTQPDFLYEATRVYLMLGNAGPLDRDLVHEWMRLDWEATYPGDAAAPLRTALLRHLDALLAEPLPDLALDGALVAQARANFGTVSLAQRAYSRIRPSIAAQRLPPWRPSEALGPAGAGLFVRASGKSLSEGVPGFFTPDGFHKVLLPALDTAARGVVAESWVLGQTIDLDPNGPQMHALQRQTIALYETDYARIWDTMLADLNVVQLRSVPRAAQDLYILASPESPMRTLLASLARQLRLSATDAPTTQAADTAPGPATDTTASRLQAVLAKTTAADTAAALPGAEIDARYQPLLTLVGDGPGAPIDLVLRSLSDLQQEMAKLAAAAVGAAPPAPPPASDPALLLAAEAARQPPPVGRWLASIANSGVALRGGTPRSQIATIYNGPGGPAAACTAAVTRFPFVRTAAADLSLDDFSRLFAPGGLFDGFVNTVLRPYIDMTGPAWHPQAAEGVAAPISAAELAQFQRAAAIRDAFFAAGGTAPAIRLDMAATALDKASKTATLDVGGSDVVASHAPPQPTQMAWPAAADGARVTFDPPPAKPAILEDSGPWALFRLVGRAKMQPAAADRSVLTFQSGDRSAAFEVRTGTGGNPFAAGLLADFHCPEIGGT
jgi:type VI secretion system protein ImpL